MSDIQLGELAPATADRDATHIAVAPMVAAEEMAPGAHCGLVDGGAAPTQNNIGIVDPFLTRKVMKGQKFFLCLYPRTVVGLRHHYLHPELDGHSVATSRNWIERWASRNSIGYDELMEYARTWAVSKWDDYWTEGGRFEGTSLPADFWDHYDRVTSTKTPNEKRRSFFSCSC